MAVFDPKLVGLWTIPIPDLIKMIRKAGEPLPDWMDQDIVVTARGDNYGVTFLGYLVGSEDPPVFENLLHQGKDGKP
jgi:hypothetical protein